MMGIEEKVQTKSMGNIVNKIIAENFPNHEKKKSIQIQEVSDSTETRPQHIIAKTLSTENKKRILKEAREKYQVTYKSKSVRITDFTTESLKQRRHGNEVFQVLKENNCKP
jgi:hypothetical protein